MLRLSGDTLDQEALEGWRAWAWSRGQASRSSRSRTAQLPWRVGRPGPYRRLVGARLFQREPL